MTPKSKSCHMAIVLTPCQTTRQTCYPKFIATCHQQRATRLMTSHTPATPTADHTAPAAPPHSLTPTSCHTANAFGHTSSPSIHTHPATRRTLLPPRNGLHASRPTMSPSIYPYRVVGGVKHLKNHLRPLAQSAQILVKS